MPRTNLSPRSLTALLALLLSLTFVIGCESEDGSGGGSPENGTTDSSTGDDAGSSDAEAGDAYETAGETGPDSAEDAATVDWGEFDSCTYAGTVLDEAGQPLEGLPVVICSEDSPFCGSGKTKADGTWQVSGLDRIPLGAKVLGALADTSSMTIPLAACSQPSTDIGVAVLSALSAGEVIVAEAGGSAQALPELRLDLPAGLVFPNYETETAVRAARLDPADIHPFVLAEISPRLVYALAPYGTESPSPITFELTSAELSGAVTVYRLDHLTGKTHKVCDTEVNDGRISCGEAGLPELSWLLVE